MSLGLLIRGGHRPREVLQWTETEREVAVAAVAAAEEAMAPEFR